MNKQEVFHKGLTKRNENKPCRQLKKFLAENVQILAAKLIALVNWYLTGGTRYFIVCSSLVRWTDCGSKTERFKEGSRSRSFFKTTRETISPHLELKSKLWDEKRCRFQIHQSDCTNFPCRFKSVNQLFTALTSVSS